MHCSKDLSTGKPQVLNNPDIPDEKFEVLLERLLNNHEEQPDVAAKSDSGAPKPTGDFEKFSATEKELLGSTDEPACNREERRHPQKFWSPPEGDKQRQRRMGEKIANANLSGNEKAFAHSMLLKHSGPSAHKIYPSQETMAKEMGCDPRTICRWVGRCEREGIWDVERAPIKRERDGTVHREYTNRYHWRVPKARGRRPAHRHDSPVVQNSSPTENYKKHCVEPRGRPKITVISDTTPLLSPEEGRRKVAELRQSLL